MKNKALSFALLYSLQLTPFAAEPPVEQVPQAAAPDETVREAVATTEYSEVLPEFEKLDKELRWSTSDMNRVEIIVELGFVMGRRQLNKHNFKEKRDLVIAHIIAQRAFLEAQKHLYDRSAVLVANSEGENARVALKKQSVSSVLQDYSDWNLKYKVEKAVHHPNYRNDRHCHCFIW